MAKVTLLFGILTALITATATAMGQESEETRCRGALMSPIEDYHIHIYFNEQTLNLARKIGGRASEEFGLELGRFHERPVGPHPRWSVQLIVPRNLFGEVLTWFAMNREGLTVFVHPNSNDELRDHTEHAIWLGEILELNTEIFQ